MTYVLSIQILKISKSWCLYLVMICNIHPFLTLENSEELVHTLITYCLNFCNIFPLTMFSTLQSTINPTVRPHLNLQLEEGLKIEYSLFTAQPLISTVVKRDHRLKIPQNLTLLGVSIFWSPLLSVVQSFHQ